jgi:hypothetical protein
MTEKPNVLSEEPSEDTKKMLDSLEKSVKKALEKKKRLGQYAVTWENGKPVLRGEDAPPSQASTE